MGAQGGGSKNLRPAIPAARAAIACRLILRKTLGTKVRGRISMANRPQPPLSIMSPPASTTADPPANLGPAGLSLWRSILAQYDITDAGGLALLGQAALACDRAERLRAEIDAAGEILPVVTGRGNIPD